jgi:hypothetical protein
MFSWESVFVITNAIGHYYKVYLILEDIQNHKEYHKRNIIISHCLVYSVQIYLILLILKTLIFRFPKELLVLTYFWSFTFWVTNFINSLVETLIYLLNEREDCWKLYGQIFIESTLPLLILFSIHKIVKALDTEDFDYYYGENTRAASIEVTHYFSL